MTLQQIGSSDTDNTGRNKINANTDEIEERLGDLEGTGSFAPASEANAGVAEVVTDAEVDGDTDNSRIVTPLKLFRRLKKALRLLSADPGSPADGEAWVRSDLATPELRVRVGGVTKTVGGSGGGGGSDDQTAAEVPYSGSTNLSATNVEAALDELDSEKAATGHTHSGLAPTGGSTGQVLKKNSDTNYDYSWQADSTGSGGGSDDQTAAEVPYSGSSGVSATDVEGALDELDSEKVAKTALAGGTTGQVLKKNSGTDHDYSWAADATGGGGGSSVATGAFRARRSSNQSLSTGFNVLNFDTDSLDVSGWFDTGDYRYEPQSAGVYRLEVSATIAGMTDGSIYTLYLRKNGSDVKEVEYVANSTNGQTIYIHDIVEANGSTDYFDARIYAPGAVTLMAGAARSTFSGEYLGTAS